ncbi:MAG: PspA/IM30 family protein [Deltaproteobacteria bacterium]|nr:PspA/IM30 family protein [Deltaproteobacteria bacterium]MBW2067751.1 PspA/IM30 family protein [Deltaproteobacteria bacterium]
MAGILQRIFKIGQAEAHSVVDKLEDPIKLTEQGIRDLKKDLSVAMQSLAEVKALAIRLKKQMEDARRAAKDYERKAMLILEKAKKGELDPQDAEHLAMEALTRKQESEDRATQLATDYEAQNRMAMELQAKVEQLKKQITTYENELITLKARAKTAQSMRKINQQLAKVDSSSTLAMLERMKQKVAEEESLAEAYGNVAAETASVDQKIDRALATPSSSSAMLELEELKKKVGLV